MKRITFLLALAPLTLAASLRAQTGDAGRGMFAAHCASCHGSDGKGTEGGPPPLRDAPWIRGSESRLIKIVLHGVRGRMEIDGKTYDLEMPGFGRVLSDSDVAEVLSFVRRSFGRETEPVTPAGVRRVRDANRDRSAYWTVEELLQEP